MAGEAISAQRHVRDPFIRGRHSHVTREREALLRAFHARGRGSRRERSRAAGATRGSRLACRPGACSISRAATGAAATLGRARSASTCRSRSSRSRQRQRVVQGRAQALPFADAASTPSPATSRSCCSTTSSRSSPSSRACCAPGAPFVALLGGGPTADGDDAFHAFARARAARPRRSAIAARAARRAGASCSPAGATAFERWSSISAARSTRSGRSSARAISCAMPTRARASCARSFPASACRCTVVTYCATR